MENKVLPRNAALGRAEILESASYPGNDVTPWKDPRSASRDDPNNTTCFRGQLSRGPSPRGPAGRGSRNQAVGRMSYAVN